MRAAVLVCMTLIALHASAAAASSSINWSPGIAAILPGDAVQNPYSLSMSSVSCPSPGTCAAIGTFLDTTGHYQGLVVNMVAGTWQAGVTAPLPANAGPTAPSFQSVSCVAAGECVAVGSYSDNSASLQGVLLRFGSGSSGSAVEASLPSNASATNPRVELSAVSCPAPGSCSAVGSYVDTGGDVQGLLLGESGGVWGGGVELTLPPDAGANSHVAMASISCRAAASCTAVGTYVDSSGHSQGVLVAQSAGIWGAGLKPVLPANAGTNSGVLLPSVSCASPGNCVAVGRYLDTADQPRALVLTQSSGAWMPGIEAPLPANASTTPNAALYAVSCTPLGACTAVGNYAERSPSIEGLLVTESSGTWTAAEAQLPANAQAGGASLGSVACPAPGECAVAGRYMDMSSDQQGLLLTQSADQWLGGVEATLPAGSEANPAVVIDSVSCAAVGYCAAVGSYLETGGHAHALLIEAQPAVPSLTVSAPRSATAGRSIRASRLQAVLAGGASPTGALTFRAFGPQRVPPRQCLAGGRLLGYTRASGDGTYRPPKGFRPTRPGTYWWYARYGGDTGDKAVGSKCGRGMARTVVRGPKLPRVRITSAHISSTRHTAEFTFRAPHVRRFQCALVKSRPNRRSPAPHFGRCSSPKSYAHLAGSYVFEVRARSAVGAGPPSRRRFTV